MSDIHSSRKSNFKPNSAVDSGAFEKLESLLKDNETTIDTTAFLAFLGKGFGTQLTQTWSYYSHINDHAKFTSCTIALTKFVKKLGEVAELITSGVEVIKDVLINYTKVLYRALSSSRPSLVNPTIRLLNEFVMYSKGALIDDFVSLFDFQLAVLPKLLNPTKAELSNVEGTKAKEFLSIRYCFIRFLLNLLKFANSLVRKDFITANVKIFSAWFKHITVIDSEALIRLTLTQWTEFILKADGISKTLKLKVFNEWNIVKLIPLYHSADKELRSDFNQFLITLFNDSKAGISFQSEETWFTSPPSSSNSSSTVLANGKNFKVNNKIIYSILTSLKPWDDDTQLQLTITTLQTHSELIPPYMNYLASRGLHDPKLTNYWLGQTLLLSKVIRLAIPEDITKDEAKAPSVVQLRELTVPSALTRNVLMKCMNSEVFLIRQLSNQLVLDSLAKLTEFIQFLNEKNLVDLKVELVQAIYAVLPDLSSVCSALSDSYAKQPNNKILLLTTLMIISKYVTLFNDMHNYSTAITKPYVDLIGNSTTESFSNIDLVLLDQFFKLQKDQASQFKWWMKAPNSEHALFTSLLQIATSSKSSDSYSTSSGISHKIEELLETLTSQTVIFNTESLKTTPITPLIQSFHVISTTGVQLTPVYKVIDETISRAVKTPFKYLDRSNELNRVSVFIVALLEQWKYLDRSNAEQTVNGEKWLGLFLRYAVISGEDSSGVDTLLEEVENAETIKALIKPSEADSQDPLFKSQDRLSFADLITITPLSQLSSSLTATQRPVNEFDILAVINRLSQLIGNTDLKLSKPQNVLNTVLTQLGDVLYSQPQLATKFSSFRYWGDLYLSCTTEVGVYISQVLSDVFEQLDSFDSSDFSKVVLEKLQSIEDLQEDIAVVLGGSVWCLSDSELRSVGLSHKDDVVTFGVLRVMLDRKLTLCSDEIVKFSCSELLLPLLVEFVKKDLIIFGDVKKLLEGLAEGERALVVLKELIDNEVTLPQIIEFISEKRDLKLSTFVLSNVSVSQLDSVKAFSQLEELTTEVTINALSLLKSQDFSTFSTANLSNIFAISSSSLSQDDKEFVLDYYLTTELSKYSNHVTSLITTLGSSSNGQVKTWVNKSILYLTKIFAEYPVIPDGTLNFIESFKELVQKKTGITSVMNKLNLDALLEVIFTKWTKCETALEFCAVLLSSLDSKVKIGAKKLLQILINSDGIALIMDDQSERIKYLTVSVTWKLFNLDVSSNATINVRDRLLQFYTGSTKASDLLLLSILEAIEGKLGTSWIDSVFSWDLVEGLSEDDEDLVGTVRFIEKKKEGLLVTLNKRYITNGLTKYQIAKPQLPKSKSKWSEIEEFYANANGLITEGVTYYDPFFLTLLIINNDELVKLTTVEDSSDLITKVNVKKLLDFDLLQTLILNLSTTDDSLLQTTLRILSAILTSMSSTNDATFKDAPLIKLYLTKILFTFHTEPTTPRTPLTVHLISQLLPLLNNPAHNLYEKAYRWVLKSPKLHPNDIPLYTDISSFSSKDPLETNDVYYKNISWLLEQVNTGLKTEEDLKLLRSRGFVEWALNLQNSPYLPTKAKYQIIELLSHITELESGAGALISRYAGLLNLEQEIVKSKDFKTNKEIKKVQNDQYLLNLKELGVKYGVVAGANKRIRDWTEGEVEGVIKRCVV